MTVTDDTAACELIRQPVQLVTCATPNPKVTVPGDLLYIQVTGTLDGQWLQAETTLQVPEQATAAD
jgi:hypothetical protein